MGKERLREFTLMLEKSRPRLIVILAVAFVGAIWWTTWLPEERKAVVAHLSNSSVIKKRVGEVISVSPSLFYTQVFWGSGVKRGRFRYTAKGAIATESFFIEWERKPSQGPLIVTKVTGPYFEVIEQKK